ncbi:MFS general substrate transporter [Clavulina sp. PMI_390]|nr:MFS general substrate transporter [Clavulina sp. PMI_390]
MSPAAPHPNSLLGAVAAVQTAAATITSPDSTTPPSPTSTARDVEQAGSGRRVAIAASAKEKEAFSETASLELQDEKSQPIPEVDANLVTWDSDDDQANPMNWSKKRKWVVTWTVSLFTLMSPISSSMMAPAIPNISYDVGMDPKSVLASMSLSIFVLAYAVGPLLLGPLSELMGRTLILQVSNLMFLVFNIACSQAQTTTQLLIFRFLAGFGGSAPLAVGGGALSDMFKAEERGAANAIYSMMPLTGPALGPIAGGWIAEKVSWRWVFYSTSIADGIVQVMGFFFLRETYAPKILGDKAARLRKETGNDKLHTIYDRPDRTYRQVVRTGLYRPLEFLLKEPIVQVFACYQAALYGLMYLTLTTFAELWTLKYGMSVGIGSLNYIALGLGFYIGAVFAAKMMDKTYAKLKAQNGGVGTPEMRIPLMIITSFLVPIGLVIYGWTADTIVFWIVPDIGAMIFCIGIIGAFISITTYLIDNYTIYSASALAAAAGFRSLAGFGFPLFANTMFQTLGIGWGNTLCAGIIVLFLPAPWIFYRYGPWLRSRSRYARRPSPTSTGAPAASTENPSTSRTVGTRAGSRPLTARYSARVSQVLRSG